VKVFLDTNVLVAAFATRGLCADVLRYILAEHQFVTGEVVLTELQRALSRLKVPPETVEAIVSFLREHEVAPKPNAPSDLPIRDPDDRWILASAAEAGVDILVTGDADLLEVAPAAPLRVLTPRAFWEMVRGGG
jgi:putative PIN family toxin of toxin-antitoxin system